MIGWKTVKSRSIKRELERKQNYIMEQTWCNCSKKSDEGVQN